ILSALFCLFFFSSRRRHTRSKRDWSSDVCSSDLIIRERQAEGIARAKARGVYKGRPKALTDEQLAQAQEWVSAGVPKAKVARRLGIGRTTLYNYLKADRA